MLPKVPSAEKGDTRSRFLIQFLSGCLGYVTPELVFLLPMQICLLLLPRPLGLLPRACGQGLFIVGHGLLFVILAAGGLPWTQRVLDHQEALARVAGAAMI